jgi:hypothetical protein
MDIDDYSNFEKPILGPAGIVRLLIAFCGVVGVAVALFAGISLESPSLAMGGAVLALISTGLFIVTRFVE